MLRACDSLLQKLIFNLENPDLAKDCGYSKKTIQYLEWTGFLFSFILFIFRCKLGISVNAFFYSSATTFCYNLIIFTIAVSNENRINNLTTMSIIQRIFIVTGTIIFPYEILLFKVMLILTFIFTIIFGLSAYTLNRKFFSFRNLQLFNLIVNVAIVYFYFTALIIIWSIKISFIYQAPYIIIFCFLIIQILLIPSLFIVFCILICCFCWQFGNTLRMRRYFIAANACKYGDIETIKAMKLYGLFLSDHLKTKLDQSLVWDKFGIFENFIRNLLRNGNSIDELPLIQAIKYGHLEVTKFLINKYHLDNKDFERANELQLACARGHLEIVRYLLDIRFNNGIGLDNHYGSALVKNAIILGYEDILKLLLENRANPYDHFILIASRNGHLGIVKYLYEQGLSLQMEDEEGTCIIHAALGGHIECIVWMLNNGSSLFEKNQKSITCETILKQKNLYQTLNSVMKTKSSKK